MAGPSQAPPLSSALEKQNAVYLVSVLALSQYWSYALVPSISKGEGSGLSTSHAPPSPLPSIGKYLVSVLVLLSPPLH